MSITLFTGINTSRPARERIPLAAARHPAAQHAAIPQHNNLLRRRFRSSFRRGLEKGRLRLSAIDRGRKFLRTGTASRHERNNQRRPSPGNAANKSVHCREE